MAKRSSNSRKTFNAVFQWLTEKPATKAALFMGMVATFMVNIIVVCQNSKSIETARQAILLSMEPSIEIQFYSDIALIRNTSPTTIIDLRLYPITYKFDSESPEILDRNVPSGPYPLAHELQAGKNVEVQLSKFVNESLYDLASNDPTIIRVAIITFRRQVDLKKFSAIEIFDASNIHGILAIFPLFSGKNVAVSGPPGYFIEFINKILEVEETFFKVGSFQ